MKDEPAGIPISDLVDLRSKMYSYIKENNKNEKKHVRVLKRM